MSPEFQVLIRESAEPAGATKDRLETQRVSTVAKTTATAASPGSVWVQKSLTPIGMSFRTPSRLRPKAPSGYRGRSPCVLIGSGASSRTPPRATMRPAFIAQVRGGWAEIASGMQLAWTAQRSAGAPTVRP